MAKKTVAKKATVERKKTTNITKGMLIDMLSKKASIKKVDAENFVKSFVEVISETLTENKDENVRVCVTGLGIFKVSYVAGRTGVNPLTKEKATFDPYHRVLFTAAQGLKDSVNDVEKEPKKKISKEKMVAAAKKNKKKK